MIIDTLMGGLTAIFGGGLTSLLGVAIQRYADYKAEQLRVQARKDQNAHELQMVEANAKVAAAEWAGRTSVAKAEAEGRIGEAEQNAFAASFSLEPRRYAEGPAPKGWAGTAGWFLMVLADFVRGIVRPGLTIYLCAITTLIYFEASGLIDEYGLKLGVAEAERLISRIIETILYLTTTCVLWWFGTRNPPATRK